MHHLDLEAGVTLTTDEEEVTIILNSRWMSSMIKMMMMSINISQIRSLMVKMMKDKMKTMMT